MVSIEYVSVASLASISKLRNDYLNTLPESQELFLELFVQTGNVTIININQQPVGYFIYTHNNMLVEYHIIEDKIKLIDTIFKDIVKKFNIKSAYCKSFDFNLLSCCADIQKRVVALGINFREYHRQDVELPDKNISVRLATENDYDHIVAINEEIFDTNDEILEVIQHQNMLIFEDSNTIVGFGIFQRVINNRPEFDIGMLVDNKYRSQGMGTFIIQYLADYCQQRGWRPTCGCSIENIASRKCLEKAGFIGRYRTLEFVF
ncbi:GNAT family N-acetyltransferase [candidate division KSB1 bacterium]|nr:GNAT family N-acetyltransferase [candidate division KSB1 bacterium]